MKTLTNTNMPDETKEFIKTCIEKEEFCDVTLAFKDGHRSCNTFVFLWVSFGRISSKACRVNALHASLSQIWAFSPLI